jgi:serine/threonine protein kinase
MARSRIGQLALEAPLGGPQSNLFRAIHLQQRVQVAVRVFPLALGLTPEAKTEFSKHLDRLKAIRNQHLVRCYGGGLDAKDAYIVYEMVDGESLSEVLQRRERLPWESVLQMGLQLCEALKAIHEQGIIHGRIWPDKVLICDGGETFKLNDLRFEFASHTPLSLYHLATMPPESFADKARPEVAWDLYSLGATMYWSLTGQPPFHGESASILRHAVTETSLPGVATMVFDCPVWLCAIVEQMLHRDPLRRPYSAAAAAMALREAERRAREGIGVVEYAVSGFSPLQLKADRAEAEKVLGIKKKKVRNRDPDDENAEPATSFWERPVVLVAALVAIIGVIIFLLWPLNESQMRSRAESLLRTDNDVRWNDARDKYLQPMLEKFPMGQHAEWAQEQLDRIEMHNGEERMRRNMRIGREPSSEGERKYAEALRFERFGDRVTALDKYQGIVKLLKDEPKERPFVNLAKRQIEILESNPPSVEELKRFLQDKMTEADKLYNEGDVLGARKIWEGIVSLYNGNQEMTSFVEQSQTRLEGNKKESTPKEP